MAELFAAILEIFSPKSKTGKTILGVLIVLVLVIAIIELVAAAGG